MAGMESGDMMEMMEDRDHKRMPIPEPPGKEDSVLRGLSALTGLRAAPGPSTTGAAAPQLNQAMNLLVQATQIDPEISTSLKPMINLLIELITSRQHIAVPLGGGMPMKPMTPPGMAPLPPSLGAPVPPIPGQAPMPPFLKTLMTGV